MFRRYPSFFVLGCMLLGIFGAELLQVPAWPLFLLAVISVIIAFIAFTRNWRITAMVLFSVALGCVAALLYSLAVIDLPPHHVANLVPRPTLYQVYGSIADWPDLKVDRTEITIAVDSLRGDDRTARACGAVLLRISDTTTALQRGDRLEFIARLYPVQHGQDDEPFSYRRFLQLKGIAAMAYMPTALDVRVSRRSPYGVIAAADRLRDLIVQTLRRDLSPEASSLALGFLIGETRDISPELYDRFRNSGTLHLLAVSGSNVGLILGVVLLLLRPFLLGRVSKGIVLLTALMLFALMSYLEPSVVRASVMAALVILATMVNRRFDLNQIIGLTAVIVLLAKPTQLFEIGFQLSFVTAWGLVAFVPPIVAKFQPYRKNWWFRWLVVPVIVSVVAQICSAPIIAYYFGQIPILSVPANLVVVILVAIAVIGVVVVLLAHLLLPSLGLIVGTLLSHFMTLVVGAVSFFGSPDLPRLSMPPHIPSSVTIIGIVLAYGTIALAVWGIANRKARTWAVICTVLFMNGVLGYGIAAGHRLPPPQVLASNIPGGVMVLFTSSAHHSTDMVITGARGRAFPLDSVVIGEELHRLNITEINQLIIMQADYDALDDLLRLAKDFSAGQIAFRGGLRASVQEVHRTMAAGISNSQFQWYEGNCGEATIDGIQVGSDLVVFREGDFQVEIVAGEPDQLQPDTSKGLHRLLVVGCPWYAQAEDWIQVKEKGVENIVCARIAQRTHWKDPLGNVSFDQQPPEYVHDLTVLGPFCRDRHPAE